MFMNSIRTQSPGLLSMCSAIECRRKRPASSNPSWPCWQTAHHQVQYPLVGSWESHAAQVAQSFLWQLMLGWPDESFSSAGLAFFSTGTTVPSFQILGTLRSLSEWLKIPVSTRARSSTHTKSTLGKMPSGHNYINAYYSTQPSSWPVYSCYQILKNKQTLNTLFNICFDLLEQTTHMLKHSNHITVPAVPAYYQLRPMKGFTL